MIADADVRILSPDGEPLRRLTPGRGLDHHPQTVGWIPTPLDRCVANVLTHHTVRSRRNPLDPPRKRSSWRYLPRWGSRSSHVRVARDHPEKA
jgi:hypothetical protein